MKKQYKKLASMGKYTTKFHEDNSQDIKLEAISEIADFIMNTIIFIFVTFLSAIKLYKISLSNVNTWILILIMALIVTYIMLKIVYLLVKYCSHSARFKKFISFSDGNYKLGSLKMIVVITIMVCFFSLIIIIIYVYFPHVNTIMLLLLLLLAVVLSELYLLYYFPGLFFRKPKSKNNKKWKHHNI